MTHEEKIKFMAERIEHLETQHKSAMDMVATLMGKMKAMVEAEREACAKVCEEDLRDEYLRQDRPVQDEVNLLAAIADCASAIRARGQA